VASIALEEVERIDKQRSGAGARDREDVRYCKRVDRPTRHRCRARLLQRASLISWRDEFVRREVPPSSTRPSAK
jgi:hypothetical protein